MTKKKARALAHEIAVKCDEGYLFACKAGAGCQIVCNPCGDTTALLTILLGVVEETFRNLAAHGYDRDKFKIEFVQAVTSVIEEAD